MNRQELVAEMQSILRTAKTEGRDLTAAEAARFDTLDAQVGLIDAEAAETGDRGRPDMRAVANGREGASGNRDAGPGDLIAAELRAAGVEGRALSSGAALGQAITPAEHSPVVFDFLAANAVGLASGFTVIETERGSLEIPHATSDGSAGWTAEGDVITPSDPGGRVEVATPSKLASITVVSNEVVNDSNPSVLDHVGSGVLRDHALGFDRGAFEGTGAGAEITGLRNIAGVQVVDLGTDGAALTNLDPIADAIGLLAEANATASAIVMHPRTWRDLSKIKTATDSTEPLLTEAARPGTEGIERRILGVPVYLSSQLSIDEAHGTATNASSVYVYEAAQVVAVRRQEARVEVDRSRLFNSDQSEIRCVSRWDVVVPNPAGVCRIAGVLPSA